jgi:tetratricopeptide (TPR) repeat protein
MLHGALDLATRGDDFHIIRLAHMWLADLDMQRGNPEGAIAHLQGILDRPGLEEPQVTLMLPLLASAYLESGQVQGAEETVTAAVERARREVDRLALADALRAHGTVLARGERWEEAEDAFREGTDVARQIPYPYAAARSLYEWGRMEVARGRDARARDLLDEAFTLCERLGAAVLAERIRQVLASSRSGR